VSPYRGWTKAASACGGYRHDVLGADVRDEQTRLPPEARSAGAARAFLNRILTAAGRQEWADAALLAVSEVVTNAVLHARTEIQLRVRAEADSLLVEVRDFASALPRQRSYAADASTGRGLELVELLTADHGVRPHGAEGKTVWFRLGRAEPDVVAPVEGDEAVVARDATAGGRERLRVRLEDLPVALWLAAQQHHDAMLRELALHGASGGDGTVDPSQLAAAALAEADVARAVAAALDTPSTARSGGTADVELDGQQAEAFAVLQDVLDAGERLARTERLLVRPGLPEIVALRDWCCEQVLAQQLGVPASPWPGTDSDRFLDRDPAASPERAGWDAGAVRDADTAVVAADGANRILALSGSAAGLLGWEASDLVGRRIVTVIPHRFREQHVAGFTRHLSTGESSVLGVDLELPVLRRDGVEVACQIRIERAPTRGGREVYVARIQPL